jgi:hypothetical protein
MAAARSLIWRAFYCNDGMFKLQTFTSVFRFRLTFLSVGLHARDGALRPDLCVL